MKYHRLNIRRRTDRWPMGKLTAASLIILSVVLFGGCDLALEAIILSPGQPSIEVGVGDTIAFEGQAIGGIPFADENKPYGYGWDVGGNTLEGKDVTEEADDGTTTTTTETGSTAEQAIKLTFNVEGAYVVTLTVTDRSGGRDTASVTVVVQELTEIHPLEAIILTPSVSSMVVDVGTEISFEGVGRGGVQFDTVDTGVNGVEAYGYFWDVGTLNVTSDTSTSFRTVRIKFDKTGVFDVPFTVKDSRGVTDTATVQVTVVPAG